MPQQNTSHLFQKSIYTVHVFIVTEGMSHDSYPTTELRHAIVDCLVLNRSGGEVSVVRESLHVEVHITF